MKFLNTLILTTVLNLGIVGAPLFAQTTPSGPVQIPALTATNTPTATPAPSAAPSTDDTTGDIRDIRGPISIPYQWLWAMYVVAGLLAIAALYALWRWIRSRVKIKAKLPYEIALDKLEAARAFMTEDTVREYAFMVSEIIRSYIEQRFGEKAQRRTTEEFLSDLLQQTNTPLAEYRDLLADFLNHCDLPKFARWQLSVREMESMHESARAFILNTRPQAQPAKAPAPAQPELVPAK
jgi:hypothetical protein